MLGGDAPCPPKLQPCRAPIRTRTGSQARPRAGRSGRAIAGVREANRREIKQGEIKDKEMARPAGVEPAASGLEVPCSIQLS